MESQSVRHDLVTQQQQQTIKYIKYLILKLIKEKSLSSDIVTRELEHGLFRELQVVPYGWILGCKTTQGKGGWQKKKKKSLADGQSSRSWRYRSVRQLMMGYHGRSRTFSW